jgi:hypothetical protein
VAVALCNIIWLTVNATNFQMKAVTWLSPTEGLLMSVNSGVEVALEASRRNEPKEAMMLSSAVQLQHKFKYRQMQSVYYNADGH